MASWLKDRCGNCGGHGIVSDYGMGDDFYGPKDCDSCDGAGSVWISSGDRVALYPGGPLKGRWPGRFAYLTSPERTTA